MAATADRATAGEAKEMMQTYLAQEEEALDGFEFLTNVGVQGKHVEVVRESSLRLAADEARG